MKCTLFQKICLILQWAFSPEIQWFFSFPYFPVSHFLFLKKSMKHIFMVNNLKVKRSTMQQVRVAKTEQPSGHPASETFNTRKIHNVLQSN